MSQLVVLGLGEGSWQQGFPNVIAQIWEIESRTPMKFIGGLPPAPKLPQLYQRWQSLYQALSYRLHLRQGRDEEALEFDDSAIAQVSEAEFQQLCQQLKDRLNVWLNSGSFGKIERQLRTKLMPTEEIRIVIETEDEQLRRFPWHLWNFFEDYPRAEVSLSIPEYERIEVPRRKSTRQVRILAVLGNSQGIEIQKDRALLEQVPGAKPVFLVEPQRTELDRYLWDEQGWDILFFAGHSSSQSDCETGEMEINGRDRLTIPQLRNALKTAIARGLQLAIFNSCDGLGLARNLADLNLPHLIVMREPVPDRVAQEFLKHFLAAFAGGRSLYLAVREAKEKLQGLEADCPCACWLPVLCHNPTAIPPTWQGLRGQISLSPSPSVPLAPALAYLLISTAIAILVMGMKIFGLLQPPELKAFDQLMRLRPSESLDERIVVVGITGTDVQNQDPSQRQGRSLSDAALAQLLQELDRYQPRAIGLDIYRDLPIDPQYPDLIRRFQSDNRLIAACKIADGSEDPGIPPPKDISPENLPQRAGFSDIATDSDGILRRQLLGLAPPTASRCQVTASLSLTLALHYLQEEGITAKLNDRGDLQVEDTVFRTLGPNSGGYSQIDAGGYQVLLNYRASGEVAPQLTLADFQGGNRLDPELIRDRIVLIGTMDRTFRDLHHTPYSQGYFQEMPGVIIQAHMVSQILSAVQDGRPLLWWLPQWGEGLWILAWSAAGGAIAGCFRSLRAIALLEGAALVALTGSCYGALWLSGGWLPLIPAVLTVIVTSGTVVLYQRLIWHSSY